MTTATSEAECVAFCDAAKEATFKRVILFCLQRQLAGIHIDIFGDNEDTMALENNPSSASRRKHIHVNFHLIQGLMRAGEIRIPYVGTKDKHIDILMKVLWRP